MKRIHIKTGAEIEAMARAGRAVAEMLDALGARVLAGATTAEIDRACEAHVAERGWIAAPKGYAPPGHEPFPGSLCASVNQQVCHGIPGPKALAKGDLLKLDCAVIVDGWHGDSCRSFVVPGAKGASAAAAERLSRLTHEAMWEGIAAARPGARLSEIGRAVEKFARAHNLGIVREFTGHGIGLAFHEGPSVRAYEHPEDDLVLEPGLCITVEPMLCLGSGRIKMMPDGWAVATADRTLCAQWEHTLAVTAQGPRVLTCSPGMEPMPERFAGRVALG